MSSVPKSLLRRYDLLQELDEVYELLNSLKSEQTATVERNFLMSRVNALEAELEEQEAETVALIDRLRDDPRAWLATRLRFIQGYSWRAVAQAVGCTEETIKARTYRKLKTLSEEDEECTHFQN